MQVSSMNGEYRLFDGSSFDFGNFLFGASEATPTASDGSDAALAENSSSWCLTTTTIPPRPIVKTELELTTTAHHMYNNHHHVFTTSTDTVSTTTTATTTATAISTLTAAAFGHPGNRQGRLRSSSCSSGGSDGGQGSGGVQCAFCKRNGETREFYSTHILKDWRGMVVCPVLRAYTCPRCHATGDNAHTESHCPLFGNEQSLMATLRTQRRSCGKKAYTWKQQ